MKIKCVGAGPAGLTFAISMKLRDPAHDVHVIERNAEGVTTSSAWPIRKLPCIVESLIGSVVAGIDHWFAGVRAATV